MQDSSTATERLLAELKNMRKNRNPQFFAYPQKKSSKVNLFVWECGFPGIELYSGGYFKFTLHFTSNFPFHPPSVKFNSPVYHPNIYTNGAVCLNILGSDWKPQLTINNVLFALQQLLGNPNPKSPANSDAANDYTKRRGVYENKIRNNVEKYHICKEWYKK